MCLSSPCIQGRGVEKLIVLTKHTMFHIEPYILQRDIHNRIQRISPLVLSSFLEQWLPCDIYSWRTPSLASCHSSWCYSSHHTNSLGLLHSRESSVASFKVDSEEIYLHNCQNPNSTSIQPNITLLVF